MERVSTAGLPPAAKLSAWHDLYSARMSRCEFTPADQRTFDAELSVSRLGPLKLARLRVDRCSVDRTGRNLAESPRLCSFLLQLKGSSDFHHYGHEIQLSEGDFVLCDTGMPHRFETADVCETVMVRVAPDVVREFLPSFERYCGLHLNRSAGVTRTAAAMVQSLLEQADFGARPDYADRAARNLLEMITMAYTLGLEQHSTASAGIWRRRSDVLRYIEDHLCDASLTAESVADGVHLSPRYLRTLFAESGEKVSDYIRRRRIEECARKMRDPTWLGQSLLKIAFSCGFNSAAHFSRCFRDRFDVSPREYRRVALRDYRAAE